MRHHVHKRRRHGDKSKAQELHARGRALHRFGIDLTPTLEAEWIAQIQVQPPRARFLIRQSHRVTLWAIKHNKQEVPIVYDSIRGTIVSILPLHALKSFEPRIAKPKEEKEE